MDTVLDDLDSITLHVDDVAAARTFYTEVLGLRELLWHEDTGQSILALPGGARLLIHEQYPDEPGRPAGTVTGIMFACADVRASAQEIARRGGTITDQPWDAPWGPAYATVADPSGNEFVLIQRERPLPSP